MESLIIAYDKNMHWIYPDLNSVLSKKFHFLWNGPLTLFQVESIHFPNSTRIFVSYVPYYVKNNNNNKNKNNTATTTTTLQQQRQQQHQKRKNNASLKFLLSFLHFRSSDNNWVSEYVGTEGRIDDHTFIPPMTTRVHLHGLGWDNVHFHSLCWFPSFPTWHVI